MREERTTWAYVDTFMYVKAADGTTWRVDGRRPDYTAPAERYWQFLLMGRQGQRAVVAKAADDEVTILVPTTDEAIGAVRAGLGISPRTMVTLEKMPTKDTPGNRSAMAAHLLHVHHEPVNPYTDAVSMASLIEMHNLAHARPQPGSVNHVHES